MHSTKFQQLSLFFLTFSLVSYFRCIASNQFVIKDTIAMISTLCIRNFRFVFVIAFLMYEVHGGSIGLGPPKVPGSDGHPPESIWDQKSNIPLWGRLLIVAGGIIILILSCFCYIKICRQDAEDFTTYVRNFLWCYNT